MMTKHFHPVFNMSFALVFIVSLAAPCLAGNWTQSDADRGGDGSPADWPRINGSAMSPPGKKWMEEFHLLPLGRYPTDEELAQTFDLSLPEMADVKIALDKKDAPGLKAALIAHLK